MPLAKLRHDYVPLPAGSPMPQLTGNIDGLAAIASPARRLQEQLERHAVEQGTSKIEKWSQRRAVAFMIGASAALWMALIVAGAQVAHAIA